MTDSIDLNIMLQSSWVFLQPLYFPEVSKGLPRFSFSVIMQADSSKTKKMPLKCKAPINFANNDLRFRTDIGSDDKKKRAAAEDGPKVIGGGRRGYMAFFISNQV